MPREQRFLAVRRAFDGFVQEGIFQRDEQPCFHAYEQIARGSSSLGIIAGVALEDFTAGRIKVHEQTLAAREELFAEYLHTTGIHAEPVLLATPEGTAWETLLDPLRNTRPEYDFSTTDRVRHRLWPIVDPALQAALQKAFARVDALYIADGHHRMASSARLAASLGVEGDHPAAWCLAFIVPHTGLFIHNFDRAVSDLNGLDEDGFLEALAGVGLMRRVDAPWSAPGTLAVRTAQGWHSLELPPPTPGADPAASLDAARLSELVLGPILGIHDLRNDPGVRFIPGTQGTAALDELVETGRAQAAFHLHTASFAQLRAVADSGGSMPPKSTWILPKLRSGLVVHELGTAG
jgi:uncharacterized protein (DUF1015 family)